MTLRTPEDKLLDKIIWFNNGFDFNFSEECFNEVREGVKKYIKKTKPSEDMTAIENCEHEFRFMDPGSRIATCKNCGKRKYMPYSRMEDD